MILRDRASSELETRSSSLRFGIRPNASAARSRAVSAMLARNWWLVALRAVAAALFCLGILALPLPSLASLVLLFTAYVIVDGGLAILAGSRAARQGERSWMLVFEGTANLMAAGAFVVWPAVIALPFVRLASAWAVVSGALMLAAARRISALNGRWNLVVGGAVSAIWGVLAAAAGPGTDDLQAIEWWLFAYALFFGAPLVGHALRLRRRHREAGLDFAGVS
jgi:uncharacterized membrane protein HdeD (DUF308 family)